MKRYIYFLLLISPLILFSCTDSDNKKPSSSTIYDFCESLQSYDSAGVRSLAESRARRFLDRDNVANPEKYIDDFKSGADEGSYAVNQRRVGDALSGSIGNSYYSTNQTFSEAFVPACVGKIERLKNIFWGGY